MKWMIMQKVFWLAMLCCRTIIFFDHLFVIRFATPLVIGAYSCQTNRHRLSTIYSYTYNMLLRKKTQKKKEEEGLYYHQGWEGAVKNQERILFFLLRRRRLWNYIIPLKNKHITTNNNKLKKWLYCWFKADPAALACFDCLSSSSSSSWVCPTPQSQ